MALEHDIQFGRELAVPIETHVVGQMAQLLVMGTSQLPALKERPLPRGP